MAMQQDNDQPPSGGCVLKRATNHTAPPRVQSAAFGRLCVETTFFSYGITYYLSAAFGRLRVGTVLILVLSAAFGRLRVETFRSTSAVLPHSSAAFGRLRVEIRVQVFRCV